MKVMQCSIIGRDEGLNLRKRRILNLGMNAEMKRRV